MKNLHFGAGNIGRGFIAQLLNKSGYFMTFVDINDAVVAQLKEREEYNINILDENIEVETINNFTALHILNDKEKLIEEINNVDLITTSIGPNVLPVIAKDIALGLKEKVKQQNTKKLDIIACENMIEGTTFLKNEIFKQLTEQEQDFINEYVGFPNSAVDRIVPAQKHDDVLLVNVEKFCEWVVEENKIKVAENKNIEQVHYVNDLNPYIERKLFTVNTGHAALSYVANYEGIKIVSEAAKNEKMHNHFMSVIEETSALLEKKWAFAKDDLENYRNSVAKRFANKLIVDEVSRICRTPIRKLGYNERFIKPIRECIELGLKYDNLAKTCAYILKFDDSSDEQSVKVQELLKEKDVKDVIKEISEFDNEEFLNRVDAQFAKL